MRWGKRLVIIVLLVAVIVALRLTIFRPDPVPVTVFVVAPGRVEETVTNSRAGTIRSRHRAKISPSVGGRVAEVPVRKGERVTEGDVLLRIDDAEYKAREALAQRALTAARQGEKEACLAADLALRELDRTDRLARDEIVSDQILDQAKNRRDMTAASCEAARARSSQLEAELQVARAELAKTVIRAPFVGIIAELTVERGEWITPSPPGVPMPSVIDLIDPESIYVSAPLDEVDLSKVEVDQPVRITMDSYPGQSFAGRLTRIAPYVSDLAEQSRTFEVEAVFDDQEFARTLPPGASIDIEVILNARDEVLRVPAYAVLEGRRVLVIEESRLAGREVTVGFRNWEFAEIREGLAEGDRVVVSLDRADVREGARAREASVVLR